MDAQPFYRVRSIHFVILSILLIFGVSMWVGSRPHPNAAVLSVLAVIYVGYLAWTLWHVQRVARKSTESVDS